VSDVDIDIARQLRRLADTLDDYMEMSLAAMRVTNAARMTSPELAEMLQPLIDVCVEIEEARGLRRYYDQ
jgi:hypothetical protein